MRDLSKLAKNALAVSSMEGGNQQTDNDDAMTAPGSMPVNRLADRDVQVDPQLDTGEPSDSARHLVNDDGDGGGTADSWNREWKNPRGTDWGVRRER